MKTLMPKKTSVIKFVAVALIVMLLSLVLYFFSLRVQTNWNRLSYAWDNEKVDWLQETDKQAQANSDKQVKEALSHVFINAE